MFPDDHLDERPLTQIVNEQCIYIYESVAVLIL
jgi:hypothetical protein